MWSNTASILLLQLQRIVNLKKGSYMKVRCTQKKVFYISKNKFTGIFIKNIIMVKLSENGISYSMNRNNWDSG